jgi:ABC-type lipoprotein export system ATPase subunit|tara:strand:- start:9377 stop:10036 length:660 start_codon:yes stop_codon:yes gene_type:complete
MPTKATDVLFLNKLEFSFNEKPLININEFQVRARERIAIMGPSGCGKSTFIHLVAGLLKPQKGTIRIKNQDITKLEEWKIDRLRGRSIGIVFQRLHLLPSISILDNLLLAQKLAQTKVDRRSAMDLLKRLDLEECVNKFPHHLSQGQAQRAAIARAVIHKPALVIGDEPTSALDDGNAQEAIRLLNELSESVGFALLIVTHDKRVRDSMDSVLSLSDCS